MPRRSKSLAAPIAAPEEVVQPAGPSVEPIAPPVAAEPVAAMHEVRQWTTDQGPRGRHLIHLGDGRRLRFIRNNALQQVGIAFEATEEGVDPRPTLEDTEFLKQHGFRWRSPEKLWTLQLLSPTDKEEVAAIAAAQGEQQARLERGKRRTAADRDAEAAFVTLANAIRTRNGQESVAYDFGRERVPF